MSIFLNIPTPIQDTRPKDIYDGTLFRPDHHECSQYLDGMGWLYWRARDKSFYRHKGDGEWLRCSDGVQKEAFNQWRLGLGRAISRFSKVGGGDQT